MNNLNESIIKATEFVNKAVDYDSQGRYEEALDYYKRALSRYALIIKNKQNAHIHTTLIDYMKQCTNRAEIIQNMIIEKDSTSLVPLHPNTTTTSTNNNNNNNNNSINLSQSMNPVTSSYDINKLSCKPTTAKTCDDIIGLENTKQLLYEAVVLPRELAHLYTGNRKPPRSILLYGPPGNGKTELARALASTTDLAFYAITSTDIISKFVGESAQNVRELFEQIKRAKPCILFIDEIDSLCSRRVESSDSNGSHATGAINELLVQLDGISGNDMDGVLLLGATNVPWSLDDAMRRRLAHKIYIPLPDEDTRHKLFEYYLSKNEHMLLDKHLRQLAQATSYYSASDIANVIRIATMLPVKRVSASNRFHLTSDDRLMPCDAKDKNQCDPALCHPIAYNSIKNKQLIDARPIMIDDVMSVLSYVKSSINHDQLKKLEKWTKECGEDINNSNDDSL